MQEFILSGSARLSANTIRIHTGNLTRFIEWLEKDILLENLTHNDIEGFQRYIRTFLCEKTQDNYANSLRSYVRHWYAHRKTNMAWELIKGPRVPEKLANFITPEAFVKIDVHFKEDEYYELTKKLIFHLLWNTGMRIGELMSLNIQDLDSQKNYTYVLTEKRKKLRVVMWNERCHELLLKYLGTRVCLNQASELFQTPPNSKYKSKRTRLTTRSVQRWCKELGRELGFPINPHAFRHGKCHYVLNNGGDRHHIQAIAGHASIESSETYTRLNIGEQVKLQERFLPTNLKVENREVENLSSSFILSPFSV